ncbi:hypothetical protein GOBAR_AA22474 [Gossypium barbadense]|uniref:3-hydroxyisobutyryl-CoA hydrolase n=1 Tax=Gossypium barbadense TaxID=3634 RepID=A0A2P5X4D7_GOSBA|nr:hypothetical protein GOBAR_AA22474 [Gossypium barbadense]
MQRVKALIVRHSFQTLRFLSHQRCFSAQPNYAPYHDFQDQVLVEGRAKSRAAILNRPFALNSLTTSMASRLKKLYESWEENPDIGFVILKGNGRAFCSGVDAVALYHLLNEGKVEDCKRFLETLYKFVYLQGTYLKPHVAILDGITMGCGGGISLPGMFHLVTDKTVWECLALTGEKLNGVEMIACGLATHYCLNARLSWVKECLGNMMNDDPTVIESSLAQYGDLVYPDRSSILHRIETIDKCFCHDTIEEIIDSLENEAAGAYDDWCRTVLRKMKEASPLSLNVTLRSIREGRFQSLDQCLAREYRMSLAAISKQVSNDFSEGVRARLVDKDFAPKWDPPRVEEVSKDMVEYYFTPLGELEPELLLPTALREPYI